MRSQSGEHAEAVSALRTSIYEKFYEKEYRFAAKQSSNALSGIDPPLDDEELPVPVDPFERSKSVKPYKPPTDFDPAASNPFGSVLDAPLN